MNLIVACSENGVIGRDGQMPWHLPRDLRHFRATTWGGAVLMGRRTHEDIGRALPGRENIVLSRRPLLLPGVRVAASLEEALRLAGPREVFIIGGGELYRQTLARARRLHLTRVHAEVAGDTHFPALGPEWREVSAEFHPADEENPLALTFFCYEREPSHAL